MGESWGGGENTSGGPTGEGGAGNGMGSNYGGNDSNSVAAAEALFTQWKDPYMTKAYGPLANAAVKAGDLAFGQIPGVGVLNTLAGLAGLPTAASWMRDSIVAHDLANMTAMGPPANSTSNALGKPSSTTGGSDMGLWDAIGSIGGAVVSGLVANSAANKQTSAAKSAASSSNAATNYATDIQNKQWQQQRQDLMPWLTAGKNALGQLTAGTGPNGNLIRPFAMSDFKADPGYAFRLSEGIKALDRSASAKGNLLSGSALKGVTQYGQNLASDEYQNAYNRYVTNQANTYNRLAGIAGTGQTAANQLGNSGSAYASNVGNLALSNAATQGNAAIAAANAKASSYAAWGNALGQGVGALANYFGGK